MKKIQKHWLWVAVASAVFLSGPSKAQTLEEALTQVYATNPVLEAERARLREVDEQVSQALGNWRPSIDAQGSTGRIYQDTPDNPLVPPSESIATHTVGVQFTQPIFRGFRTVSGVRAAEKQVAAERANLLNVEEQVFLDTATAYLDVVRDQAISDLNSDYQNVLGHQLGETRDRFSAHDVTRTDIDQATARLRRSEAGHTQAEANLAGHRAAYFHLTGEFPGKLKMPHLDMPPVKNQDEAVALAGKMNPAIIAAQENEDEARQEVTLSKGSLLPEVSLVGSTQRQWGISNLIPGRQDTAQVVAQVTIPLYRTGADYSKTRAAIQTVTERRMRLEDTRRQAEQMAITAWQNLMAARNVIIADQAEEQAAQRALHGVRVELPAGTRDTLDVLNAEQELMDARMSLAQARHDEALAVLQIRAAIGALTAEALKLPVNLYNPDTHYEAARGKLIGFDTPSGENELNDDKDEAAPEPQSRPEEKSRMEVPPSVSSNENNAAHDASPPQDQSTANAVTNETTPKEENVSATATATATKDITPNTEETNGAASPAATQTVSNIRRDAPSPQDDEASVLSATVTETETRDDSPAPEEKPGIAQDVSDQTVEAKEETSSLPEETAHPKTISNISSGLASAGN